MRNIALTVFNINIWMHSYWRVLVTDQYVTMGRHVVLATDQYVTMGRHVVLVTDQYVTMGRHVNK